MKGFILGLDAFGLALQPAAGAADLLGRVTGITQSVDIVRGMFLAILADGDASFGQTHGSQTIILGHHDIPLAHPVH